MSLPTLADLVRLAQDLPSLPDIRPAWLREMPYACGAGEAYYRYYAELVARYQPLRTVEIGTDRAVATAHLAYENTAPVVTIDHNWRALENALALPLLNIEAIYGDSSTAVEAARGHGPYDLLYIDALHDFNHAYGEYVLYRELVVDGGMIFFDDLDLDMHTRDMQILWEHIVDPKAMLPGLHATGFGVAIKDPAIAPLPWRDVIDAVDARRAAYAAAHG